jgi:hypothetical protein
MGDSSDQNLSYKSKTTSENEKHSDKTKAYLSVTGKGRKLSKEARIRMSNAHKGDKSSFWKGGISKINKSESYMYKNNWEKLEF